MPLPSPLAGIFYPSLDVPQVTSVIIEDPDPIGSLGEGYRRACHDPDHSSGHECHLRRGCASPRFPRPERALEAIRAREKAARPSVAAQ
jgi:hypothetical protein